MTTLLALFHILACLILVLVILLQSGKAGDIASAFGGAGSQTAFGARGATTFLTKATALLAVTFMATALALSIVSMSDRGDSVMEGIPGVTEQEPAPVEPVVPAQPPSPPPVEEAPEQE